MTERRIALGISGLLALVLCAFAATGASAYQQAYACTPGGTGFSDAHCASGGTGYHHLAIPEEQATELTLTNAATAGGTTAAAPFEIAGTIAGVQTEVHCAGANGETIMVNSTSASGQKYVSGLLTFELTSCTVTKPAGKGCEVEKGSVMSKGLQFGTTEMAANSVRLYPWEIGKTEAFAVSILHCSITVLNHEYSAQGSFQMTADGATWTVTHANSTTQATLKWDGNPAGVEGAFTVRMKAGDPIALT